MCQISKGVEVIAIYNKAPPLLIRCRNMCTTRLLWTAASHPIQPLSLKYICSVTLTSLAFNYPNYIWLSKECVPYTTFSLEKRKIKVLCNIFISCLLTCKCITSGQTNFKSKTYPNLDEWRGFPTSLLSSQVKHWHIAECMQAGSLSNIGHEILNRSSQSVILIHAFENLQKKYQMNFC